MTDLKENQIFDLQVLAAALRIEGALPQFVESFDPTYVGLVHGYPGIYEFYKALIAFYEKTGLDPVNPIAFKSWLLTETDIYDALGGEIGVNEFIEQLETIELSDTASIIKLVQYRAKKRQRLDRVQTLREVLSKSDGIDQYEINKLTEDIKTLSQDVDYDPLSKVRTAHDIIASVEDLWDIPPFIPTQFPELNKIMSYTDQGGFFRGGVHSIFALSGQGKSTFTKCLCNYWLDMGYSVLFINFEEAQPHWERILMTQILGVNVYAESNRATSKQLSDWTEQFKAKMEEWGDRLMVRHDPDTLFYEDLEKWLRDVLGQGSRQPDIVVIDTIQSMFTKGGKARWGEFEQMMVGLEKLAKDMNAVFIITAQQNINSTKEKREKLDQSDAGGSVTIGQKSTVSMFLTQLKNKLGDASIDDNLVEIQTTKNRITGTTFADSPPIIQYDDATKSFKPYHPQENAIKHTFDYEEDVIMKGLGY